MSLSQSQIVEQAIEALKLVNKISPEANALISYLYTPDTILEEYLSKLRVFLNLPRPTKKETQDAGYLLEEISLICFCGLVGYTNIKSFRSPSAQYDLVIGGDTLEWKELYEFLFLNFNQRDIVIESKAIKASLSDSQFARMCSIMTLSLTNAGLGIFFTLNGASGFPARDQARQQTIGNARLRQVVFHASTKKTIIVLDKNDIFTLNQNGSLITLLIRNLRDLHELSGIPNAPVEEFVEVDLPESPSKLRQIYTQISNRKNITIESN